MNEKMSDISKLVRLQILFTALFIFFKWIRPSVLTSESPQIFKTILLSLPNFFEAVIGVLIVTSILLVLNDRIGKKLQVGLTTLYSSAVLLAGIYVITQELKFHNLGGNNVYDQNDVLYSVIGLVFGYGIILYKKPRIHNEGVSNDS